MNLLTTFVVGAGTLAIIVVTESSSGHFRVRSFPLLRAQLATLAKQKYADNVVVL